MSFSSGCYPCVDVRHFAVSEYNGRLSGFAPVRVVYHDGAVLLYDARIAFPVPVSPVTKVLW